MHTDTYDLKLVASFVGGTYPQVDELPFKVNLVDYCADSVLANPGQAQTTVPYDYYYTGTASFELVPFTVKPPGCSITYTCTESTYGLCDYSEGATRSTFVAQTGRFAFTSKDIEKFGTQTITFTITGKSEKSGKKKPAK